MTVGTNDVDVDDLASLLESFCVGKTPARKDVVRGTRGRPIQLISNLYNVSITSRSVFRYTVTLTLSVKSTSTSGSRRAGHEKRTSRALNHRALKQYFKQNGLTDILPAYDGRSLVYTMREIPTSVFNGTVRVPVDEEGAGDVFARLVSIDISIKETEPLPLTSASPEVIQALDIIVRTGPLNVDSIVSVGRAFFTASRAGTVDSSVKGCRELWFGYHCSIKPGQWKPLLNVNLCATLFHESLPMIDYIVKFLNKKPGQSSLKLLDSERVLLERELQAVKIEVTHLPYKRRYKVGGLSYKGASDISFSVEGGGQMTVAHYFEKQYGITLKYPHLPCIHTPGKNGKNYIPLEVCKTIEGQHAKMVHPDQTAILIRKTAIPPAERFKNIDTFVKKIVEKDAERHLSEFGLKVDLQPVQVKGRVLDAPILSIGDNKKVHPRDGYWRMDRRSFFSGSELVCWGVADCHGASRTAEFVKSLQRLATELGMRVAPPSFVTTYRNGIDAKGMLTDIKNRYPDVILTIVILGRDTHYEEIKQLSENIDSLLMITQCVRGFNIDSRKHDDNFVTNLLMKINAKLGGTNNALMEVPSAMQEPFIVFGADVSHPGPMNQFQPSIAAVVGSLDHVPSQYHTVTSFQKNGSCNRLEYIVNLKSMIKECLRAFYRRNGIKPMTLFFFRDGVSDSQFEAVRAFEVLQVRMACKELQDDYEPPLTFLVVQKRHQVRFKPRNETEGQGRHKNIPAGTVIEDTVTHPVNFDYYLCSHAGIQGTSKPAHYQVIHDDANRSADELQAISYKLCHVYARCSRSVSIPAPVYYAHLAAARAKDHFKASFITSSSKSDNSNQSSGYGSSTPAYTEDDLLEMKRKTSNVDPRIRSFLYYV